MKSKILKAVPLFSGDKVKIVWDIETDSDCVCIVAVVGQDDDEFFKSLNIYE